MTPSETSKVIDREFYETELDEELRLYDPSNPVCRYYHLSRKERVERVCRELLTGTGAPTNGRVAADVGCGTGSYFPVLTRFADRVTGVEIARPKARAVQERYGRDRVRIVVGSATEIPLSDARYDLVLCSEVIEHFPNPQHVLAEVFRITKPGGYVVISTPVRYDVGTLLRAFTGRRNRSSRRLKVPDQHGHYWYFAPHDLAMQLAALGAEVVRFIVVPRIHFPGLARLLRTRLVSPKLLLRLGERLPHIGALVDLGAFGIFVTRKLA